MDWPPILIQKQRTSGRIGKGNGVRVEDREKVSIYETRVKGRLGWRRSEWFDGLEITNLENGEGILSEEIVDQAALHGMLAKVRDLGLPLGAVIR